MKPLRLLSLSSILLSTTLLLARPWTPGDDMKNGIPVNGTVQITSQTLGIGHLKIHISNPVVKMEQLELNKQTWTLVTIDGETRLWQKGKPSLPLICRPIRLPNTGNIQLVVTPGEFDEYTNIDVLPQQPTELKKDGRRLVPNEYCFDSVTYSQNTWYPSEIAAVTTPEIIRDARVALLGVQPVIYNPVTRTLRVYKSIDIETLPVGGIGTNEIHSTNSHAVPSFAGIYSDIIGAEDLFDDARNAPPGTILFICRQGPDTLVKKWADWKTQSGHPARIYTTTATYAAPIQTYIDDYYETANPPLETVILVADGGTSLDPYMLPTFYVSNSCSDHPYSVIGNGIVTSFWVGRIHCDNAQELLTQINRSMNYERIPFMGTTGTDTAWFTHGWGYTGTAEYDVMNAPCIRFCNDMMRAGGVTNVNYDEHSGSVSDGLIATRLTPGAIFWAHLPNFWEDITPIDIQNIQNINKPFVSIHLGDDTGDWFGPTASGMQVAETKLGSPAQPRGAIAADGVELGSTDPQHLCVMMAGTFYAFGVKKVQEPGPMFFEGKFQLYRNYRIGDSINAAQFIHWNNPMGDISARLWTGVPRFVTANVPTTINIGQNRMELQILQSAQPVSGAMVTAWKKNNAGLDETYLRAITDDSGRVVLTLTNATAGTMLLTVTGNQAGQNIYPLIDTIHVVQSPADLAYSNQVIWDDSTSGRAGNNDGYANPGEIIDLSLQLNNRGTNVATGITGTLISNDSRIVVVNNTSSWLSDSAGRTVQSLTPFRIHLLSGIQDGDFIPLRLDLVTNQGNRTITVPLTVHSIRITFISSTLTPLTVIPGQSCNLAITVRNTGTLSTGTTTAMLFSLTPYIAVETANATFAGLPVDSNVSNPSDQLFHISTNRHVVPGSINSMGVAFSSGDVRDTVFFSITIGNRTFNDPTGPDPYGYYAYDVRDTAYNQIRPTYNWVELIPAIGGTGTRLPLTDAFLSNWGPTSTDCSIVLHLPFPVRYYEAVYDSITICTNGWVAFGAQPNYNNGLNWHLPAHDGPRNIVAVNWCDQKNTGTNEGVYVKSDTVNHRFIVTWKTTTVNSLSAEEYQVVIYDSRFYSYYTLVSPLLFQYKNFQPAPYSSEETGVSFATVGIADSNYTRAIEYCYWNHYNPGCSPIPNGNNSNFAILFTTASPSQGSVSGTVRRASNNSTVTGARVEIVNRGYTMMTDSIGHYSFPNVQIGHYNLQVSGLGFNTKLDTVTIYDSLTSTLNFTLTNPTLRLTIRDTFYRPNDSIFVMMHDSVLTGHQNIFVRNTGNGALTWSSQLVYDNSTDETDSVGSQVYSFDIRQAVGGDLQIFGVEFDGINFWVTGANNYSQPHHLYKLDRNGTLLNTYNCPDTTGLYGWRDLAWDGRRYLYSAYSNVIDKIDTLNGSVIQTFIGNVNPIRAIAIDTASGLLYYGDQNTVVYKMRLSDGTSIGTLPNPSAPISGGMSGLACYPNDPDGMKLYAIVRDSSSFIFGSRLYKINPDSGSVWQRMARLGLSNERAAGLSITPQWNPLLWTACTVLQTTNSCRVALYELAYNQRWIHYAPASDTLLPGASDTVSVYLNRLEMPIGRYRVAIRFNTNDSISSVMIPVVMVVTDVLAVQQPERVTTLPRQFSLEQNYPNPFNPMTTISFSLPKASRVNFTVYNALGQVVSNAKANQLYNAGYHSVIIDGSKWATGIYFYRIESNEYHATKKMLLMK